MKKRDLIIAVVVLVVALGGMAAVHFLSPKKPADYALVYIQNYVYKKLPLNEDTVLEIDQGSGVVNHVEVKDGAVYMLDSSCPDQQCVHQGEISPENYEERILRNWVICLPNQVTIELVLADEAGA